MLKNKKILTILLAIVMVLAIPTIVNAAVEYTRNFPDNTGTIEVTFTGLELDETKAYEFALVNQGETPTTFYSVQNGYTAEKLTIVLDSTKTAVKDVLKAQDVGFVFVREKDNTTGEYALNNYKINLRLPYLQSLVYRKVNSVYELTGSTLYGAIGNEHSNIGEDYTYVQWQKITDTNLITKFLAIKAASGSISNLESYLPDRPTTGWEAERTPNFSSKNDGLYLLWVKRTGDNCKEVYSCIVHDGLPEATTVEEYLGTNKVGAKIKEIKARGGKLEHTSSGWQHQAKVGDEVSVNIKFEKTIVLNESPKLTIKFGTGSNIELATNVVASDTLTYKYTVKSEDRGALQVLDLKGGNVTDNDGTPVDLTLIDVTGDPVVAIETDEPTEEPSDNPEDEPTNEESTDFSNAKFVIKTNRYNYFDVVVENISLDKNSYYVYISKNNNEQPKYNYENCSRLSKYDDGSVKTGFSGELARKILEEVGDNYIYVIKKDSDGNETIVVNAKKIEYPTLPGLGNRFDIYLYDEDKSIFSNAIAITETRDVTYKIGKITSNDVLKSFKNDTSDVAFANLLKYAKTATVLKSGTIKPVNLDYNLVNDITVEEGAYYFIYMSVGSDNGKYYEIEDVAIYEESNTDEGNCLVHFSFADIEIDEPEKEPVKDPVKDNTNAPVKLPNTGNTVFVVVGIVTLAVLSTIGFIKYKKFSKIV